MATLVKRPTIVFWAILVISIMLTSINCKAETESQGSFNVSALEWEQVANDLVLTIKGGSPPTYTMYELFNPFRVIIDIADASIDPSLDMSSNMPQGPVSQIKGHVLEDKEPFIARIELFLNEDSSYTVDRLENDIIVKFAKPASEAQPTPSAAQEESTMESVTNAPATLTPASSSMQEPVEIIAPEQPSIQSHVEQEIIPPDEAIVEPMEIEAKRATVIFDIEVEHSATDTKVFIKADGTISNYDKVELAKNIKANRPDRIYLDIKDVKLAGPIQPKIVGTALSQIRSASRTDGSRIVFDSSLDNLFSYEVSEQADGLLVTISEPSAATSVIAGLLEETEDKADSEPTISPEPQILEPLADENNATEPEPALIAEMQDTDDVEVSPKTKKTPRAEENVSALAFAGYTKQRITVDFYKIDLHNVFRLFGEISNLNMVVDQAVGGSLTLALNDVPWDFALDIILNLKDLRKEERYNTIVISPKSKKFEWPEKTLETVEFKADDTFDFAQKEEESLKISRRQDIPETVMEAKNLIHQAQNREKLGNYTAALALYEESFVKWPENTIIARRIAALCLVRLGQNAKAVHYAKMVLKADPNDSDSAVQAAIGLARMKKTEQAKEYFEKSVSGSAPSSAALSSYAAFSEELQQFDLALTLLKRHEDIHGDSLDTMISKARIHDKQGQLDLSSSEYQAILLSGYEIPADLARYIKGRASLAGPQ